MPLKKKRIIDKGLLALIREIPCLICSLYPSDPDHITTRGAGGDDLAVNVWPICREHHTERHKIGLYSMIEKYPILKTWLELAKRDDILDRMERLKK